MKRTFKIFAPVLSLSLILSSFTTPPPPAEVGIAVIVEESMQGKKTACDNVYDKEQRTASHKTLPCGTKVKVTHLGNNKTVEVTIIERGPYLKGQIIALSTKAAGDLDMLKEGETKVKVEVVSAPADDKTAVAADDNTPAARGGDVKATDNKATDNKLTTTKAATDAKATAKANDAKAAATKPAATDAKTAATKPAATDAKATAKAVDPKVTTKPATTKPAAADAKTAAKPATTKPATTAKATTKPAAKTNDMNMVEEAGSIEKGGLYKMQVLKLEPKGFGVQVAGYSDYESVVQQMAVLQKKWFKGAMVFVDELNGKPYYKIIMGPFFTKDEADSYCANLKKKYSVKDAFVVDLQALKVSTK